MLRAEVWGLLCAVYIAHYVPVRPSWPSWDELTLIECGYWTTSGIFHSQVFSQTSNLVQLLYSTMEGISRKFLKQIFSHACTSVLASLHGRVQAHYALTGWHKVLLQWREACFQLRKTVNSHGKCQKFYPGGIFISSFYPKERDVKIMTKQHNLSFECIQHWRL